MNKLFKPPPPPRSKAAPKAKMISQTTFNEAVQENIDEFEMEVEEAVSDAIEQFEMSGIDLSNIIKRHMPEGEGAEKQDIHPILQFLAQIKSEGLVVDDDDLQCAADKRMVAAIKGLAEYCRKEPEGKAIAGSNGAITVMIRVVKCGSDAVLPEALRALTVLCTKNVSNRGSFALCEGAAAVAQKLIANAADPAIQYFGCNTIQCVCTQNSRNADTFVDHKILPHALATLKTHAGDSKVVCAVAGAIWQLARGDGSMESKAQQYAKFLGEAEATAMLVRAIERHRKDAATVAKCCSALEAIVINDKTCTEAAEAGGIKLLMEILLSCKDDEKLVCHTASCLSCFARNDENKIKIAVGSELAVGIMGMKAHLASSKVQVQAMKLLTAISLRQPAICTQIIKQEAHMAVANAMRTHPGSANVQRNGCLLLRNLVSRTKENVKPILASGVEPLIRAARNNHSSVEDVAFGALRDLGCDISEMKHYRDTGKAMYGGYMPDAFHTSTTRSSGDTAASNDVYNSIRDAAKSTAPTS